GALIILASKSGSKIFAKNWLTSIASKPLTAVPRLGSWALFLGYKKRLLTLNSIKQAATNYFGLPATIDKELPILPTASGDVLHERIANLLCQQRPVFIRGTGGAGKSTLLARLVYLQAIQQPPAG